jgi:hypothetical protein
MPYVVTTKRPTPAAPAFGQYGGGEFVSRCAVATLEEREVFDSKEWVAAGGDQPDGNNRFWHNALVLTRTDGSGLTSDGSREKLLTVLLLHDGRRSAGHFEHMTRPASPLIPESGGTVGPLPDGTVIEVKLTAVGDLAAAALVANDYHFGELTGAEVIAAFNAREVA